LIEEINGHQLSISNHVLNGAKNGTAPNKAIEDWSKQNREAVEQTQQLLTELRSSGLTDLSMVAVASRQLRALSDMAAK